MLGCTWAIGQKGAAEAPGRRPASATTLGSLYKRVDRECFRHLRSGQVHRSQSLTRKPKQKRPFSARICMNLHRKCLFQIHFSTLFARIPQPRTVPYNGSDLSGPDHTVPSPTGRMAYGRGRTPFLSLPPPAPPKGPQPLPSAAQSPSVRRQFPLLTDGEFENHIANVAGVSRPTLYKVIGAVEESVSDLGRSNSIHPKSVENATQET